MTFSSKDAEPFRGKKITVMGLGLLGRGVGDAKYLAECGAELVVTDLKSREELASSVAQLAHVRNIEFVLGEHRISDFQHTDLVLKAAGVPIDSPYIAEAKKNGIPVRMSADLFMENSGVPSIGVTGTRGKSTVTHMIAHIFERAGREVLLGGNVRGVSTLALLPEVTRESVAVLELDSWQCQGLAEARLSPHIAVFTTFYPDHLNYYKGNLDAYLFDKTNIFRFQKEGDILVLGSQAAPVVARAFPEEALRAHVARREEVAGLKLPVPGLHNRENAACARAAAAAFGIPENIIRAALESFPGVPGRLELVREIHGVKMYNDTNSTTPEAAAAALEALDPEGKRNIVLIAGGADKQLDMSALRLEIEKHAKVVFWLAGSGTERMKQEGERVFNSLTDALDAARVAAESGDVILFSPAFASFGMFKNEYDRGDQFNELVRSL